jgi:hypothetical protein
VSGTGRGFESALLQKQTRYAQCRETETVLRTLAHLLARTFPRDTKASKRANFYYLDIILIATKQQFCVSIY